MKKAKTLAIVGTQWGDEGKGKMTDYFASSWADVVVRSQGGNNAGHTISFNGKTYAVRSVPSGIFNPKVINIIADGCVINPEQLLAEMAILKCDGIKCKNLYISNRAHLILNIHKRIDVTIENNRISKIKTTGNGIGPCYADKMYRLGLRVCDLSLDWETLVSKIHDLCVNHGVKITTEEIDELASRLHAYGIALSDNVTDTMILLNNLLEEGKKVLFEGAQATMLDITYGCYPYVTSSSTLASAIPANCGIAPSYINDVMGIVKAYSTRVGAGPFVTEIKNEELVNKIRETGNEYGTVTGRPRRIGWLDLPLLKYSAKLNGLTSISLMLTDVLNGIDTLKVCVGYSKNGKDLDIIPPTVEEQEKCEPVYIILDGWKSTETATTYDELPEQLKKYIEVIEEYVGVPVKYISIGKDRTKTIEKK